MRSVGRNVEENRGGEGALFTGVPGVGPPHRPSNKRKRGRTREERQETTETSWRWPRLIAGESSIYHSLFLQRRASSSSPSRWW